MCLSLGLGDPPSAQRLRRSFSRPLATVVLVGLKPVCLSMCVCESASEACVAFVVATAVLSLSQKDCMCMRVCVCVHARA